MEFLGTVGNLLLVICGFTFIIFVHELGHFLAARWAGIRVLAFSIGFGPAAFSYRQGMGFQRGSSEAEYDRMRRAAPDSVAGISPTEYRWNYLPFGGYVKMLGQEDANPQAISSEPDSYQQCVPWKRMVVISAGVIANVILSAILFIVVFMVGMPNPAPRIGPVTPGSPAATAVASNAAALGVVAIGLQPGDLILSINGRTPNSFADLLPEVALSHKNDPVNLTVRREGLETPLNFAVKPEANEVSGVLDLGVDYPISNRVFETKTPAQELELANRMKEMGIEGVRPHMTLVSAGGRNVRRADDLLAAIEASGGKHVPVTFRDEKGEVSGVVIPRPRLQESPVELPSGPKVFLSHLLGLTPLLKVAKADEAGEAKGLRSGDVFVRIGDTEYPSAADGISEIRSHKGKNIHLVVLRKSGEVWNEVSFDAAVDRQGHIGFSAGDTRDDMTLLAMPPARIRSSHADRSGEAVAASSIISSPGSRITRVNGHPVANFRELRAQLVEAVAAASGDANVPIELQPPPTAADKAPRTAVVKWTLSADQVRALRSLGWESPLHVGLLFKPEEVIVKASSPLEAVSRGVNETRRWLLSVYVTFLRLAQGSVPVDQLHGPVGIAQLGTTVADRGMIYLTFFLAMISVNLAVVNFLPMPIVDGGQFLFLVWEQIRGKPPSIQFQNQVTTIGLILIGGTFLLLTFHDIAGLFGR